MDIQTVKDLGDNYLINDSISVPKDSSNREYKKVTAWLENNDLSSLYTTDELKAKHITEIKYQAYQRINATYPDYKQRNFNAEVSKIHNKEVVAMKNSTTYTLTADELAAITAANTCEQFILNIRTKSDELETSLDSMTDEQLEAFDPTDDNNWS